MKKFLASLAFSLLLFIPGISFSANPGSENDSPLDFPVPAVQNLLFYIQRDPNTNTICYQLNTDQQGHLSERSPVNAFWIKYEEDGVKNVGGKRRELNYLQRKFAYGINVKSLGKSNYELRSVAYSKLPLVLKKDGQNEYHVYTNIDKKECILSRVFIRIDGGSFWSPNVLYIELTGTDTLTGKKIVHRFKPS